MAQTLGARDAIAWLSAIRAKPPVHQRWYVEIAMSIAHERPPTDFDEATATRFHISIYAEEWGVYFCHRGRASWIRVTDIAFVHGRDDWSLLAMMPASLANLGTLVRRLEAAETVRFDRARAAIKTNLERGEPAIRSWLSQL